MLEYYDELTTAKFVKNELVYDLLNLGLSNSIKLFQLEESIKLMKLFDVNHMNKIEHFASLSKIIIFMPGDVIIK